MYLFLKNYIDDDKDDDDCKILRIYQTSEITIIKKRYKRSLSCECYNTFMPSHHRDYVISFIDDSFIYSPYITVPFIASKTFL